jgi:peptidylprolyl isomerase
MPPIWPAGAGCDTNSHSAAENVAKTRRRRLLLCSGPLFEACNMVFMDTDLRFFALLALTFLTATTAVRAAPPPSMSDILAASTPADWRPLLPRDTLYVELPAGRVVIELAPEFAPLHVRNIKTLVGAKYFDGLSVERVQDDYVVQWGDPDNRRPLPAGVGKLAPEFDSPWAPRLPFTRLPDGDVYAPEVGFSDGFPLARSRDLKRQWLTHCYGMVGVGRDLDVESGSGAELYVVIGHAPRHLDRNVALVGRVVKGMEFLSELPRGSGAMGFYAKNEPPTPIKSIRLAADVPPAERSRLEILRTDTPVFTALIESRRNRPEDFFVVKAGHIDLCNVPLPVRDQAARH